MIGNKIQERALRIAYRDNTSQFKELLKKDDSVSIHQKLDLFERDILEQTLMNLKVLIRERGRYNVLIPYLVI